MDFKDVEINKQAILYRPWVPGNKTDEIIGCWPEDDNKYVMNVPYQLRDQIIKLQNNIYLKQQTLFECRKKLLEAEEDFNRSLGY